MSFSIVNNITSLQAQESLRQTSDFQGKTLNRVTSGLRIIQSGDDAAGLAVANGLRSDMAVLSQGVRNANDGLSQLQTVDGGMGNISKLLDRARTLATQSASGTFSGDRNVLNSEFQSVMGEINRQAQAVGMDKGGQFAKNLSVFVGGGRASTDAGIVMNGSVGVDLSKATVDVKSLGLDTFRATNSSYDLSTTSATSVNKIIANQGKAIDGTTKISTAKFTFGGAGFGDSSGSTAQVDVSISTQGITDTAGLATAINNAIYTAANPGTETTASKAFKAAGITASIVTDSTGKAQLAFTSAKAAFQVHGDQLGNAFMGNFADSRVSKVTGEGTTNVQGGSTLKTLTTDLHLATLTFTQEDGTGITELGTGGAVALNTVSDTLFDGSAGDIAAQDVVDNLNKTLDAAADAVTTGTTSNIRAELKNGKLAFTARDGSEFHVKVTGDTADALGMIDATNPRAAGTSEGSTVDLTLGATKFTVVYGDTTLNFKDADGTDIAGLANVALTTMGTASDLNDLVTKLNSQLDQGTAGSSKIRAEAGDSGKLRLFSTDGSVFTAQAKSAADGGDAALGFGATSTSYKSKVSAYESKTSHYQALTSGGVYQSTQETSSGAYSDYSSSAYDFSGLGATGTNAQTITVNTKREDGSVVSLDIKLTGGSSGNATSASDTLDTINDALQGSSDESLKGITAIRDGSGVKFVGTRGFSVTLGDDTDGKKAGLSEVKDGAARQAGVQLDSTTQGTSGLADISSQASASSAVSTLGNAMTSLGAAQAVVGRGQNQLSFAVNLAQSQLGNLAAAESRIRDADLASEAANMTKAQVMLQAGVAAMAQANSAPQQILSLLRG